MRGILCDRFPLQLISFSACDAETVATDLKCLFHKRGKMLSWEQIEFSVTLYLQAGDRANCILGDDHPLVTTGSSNLAGLDQAQDRDSKAEPLFPQVLDITQPTRGGTLGKTATWTNQLAGLKQSRRHNPKLPIAQVVLHSLLIGLVFCMLLMLMATQTSQVLFWLILVLVLGTIR